MKRLPLVIITAWCGPAEASGQVKGTGQPTKEVVQFLLPLPFAPSFLSWPPWLLPTPQLSPSVSCCLIQGFVVLFSSLCIIHFLAGNSVLIRINIWVLFTGLQSARIAKGIQLHKLSWWEINDKLRRRGSWGSNSKPFTILVWKLSPGWFIAVPQELWGRDRISLWSLLADHQIEQLDPFPVVHEISHRIFHFKSNGMFS